MKKKILSLFLITCITLSSLVGCGKEKQPTQVQGNQEAINKLTQGEGNGDDKTPRKVETTYGEKRNDVIVSGTTVTTYPSYFTNFYGTQVEFLDVDFEKYNIGVSLPISIFNPDNLWYLGNDENGNLLIKQSDANKIILNFMDDYHFTLFCYSTGVFSTWSYTIDDDTFQNLKRADAFTVMELFKNESQISYKNGYDFEKHFDDKEKDAYRITLEIDYYPFEQTANTLFYHGYVTFLVRQGEVRAICFAEPKFNNTAPYQMGYPVSNSSYWLDIERKEYDVSEDLEATLNNTQTTQEQTTETTEEATKTDANGNTFSTVEQLTTEQTTEEATTEKQSLSEEMMPKTTEE